MAEDEEFEYTGRYTRVFLNSVVGEGNYTVKPFSLADLKTADGMRRAEEALDDPTLSFAYMSDAKLTCVWLHPYPGWMEFCKHLGIRIKPSPKIAKRLTVMTRTAYLHTMHAISDVTINPRGPVPGKLNIRSVRPGEFSDLTIGDEYQNFFDETCQLSEDDMVKVLDGANVISRELVEEMMTNGSKVVEDLFRRTGKGNPFDKAYYNVAIDYTSSMSLRITTPNGLIKGDTLVAPREHMGGFDVLYCSENIKGELCTDDFVFILAEPHPAEDHNSNELPTSRLVWTDDQSMTWLGDWLYDRRQLKAAMRDFADHVERDITENRYPSFWTSTEKLDDQYSTIQQFQAQSLEWERYGPERKSRNPANPNHGTSLSQSIFLQERVAQGAINKLAKKRRWPIMCAVYVHVATDAWLHMAGYSGHGEHPWPFEEPETPRGCAWIHEDSGRLVYNDLDFIELYDRHGGWDLDDSIKVHFRTYQGRKVLVNVRSPNSWGEYDIKDYVEGTWYPTWTTVEGDVIEFPEVGDGPRPDYLEELDIDYDYPALDPDTLGVADQEHALRGNRYTKDMARKAVKTAVKFDGVFGSRANADMVYFHTMKTYRRKQLAPIEAMVDACTQEQSDKALELIEKDTKDVRQEIVRSGNRADRLLWRQRFIHFDKGMRYGYLDWSDMTISHDELCALYQRRLMELAQRTAEVINPDIMDLGRVGEANGRKLYDWFYELNGTMPTLEGESKNERWKRIHSTIVDRLIQLPDVTIYNLILGIARYAYTHKRGNAYKDTVLFQTGDFGEPSIFHWYLDAIQFYGIGDPSWSAVVECSNCNNSRYFLDRVDYQAMLINGKCNLC